MIIGLGLDMLEIARIDRIWRRFGQRFLNRCFTINEITSSLKRAHPVQALAMRFAAKEALAKATGLGFRGLKPTDVELTQLPNGSPKLILYGRALTWAKTNEITNIYLSLSDDGDYAAVVVILEK